METPEERPRRDIAQHLSVQQYGDFRLTSAIRPSPELTVIPREGYRLETFVDDETGTEVPMLAASISAERLFEIYLEFLDELSEVVDVILESHHHRQSAEDEFFDFLREHIDLPVLKSYCHEYRELMLEDGCFGIAVVDPAGPCEIQFDDHKVLVIYAKEITRFEAVLVRHQIPLVQDLRLISEGEHLHSTSPQYHKRFEALRRSMIAD